MEIKELLKQRDKQIDNEINQLLGKKDKLSRAITDNLLHRHSHFVSSIVKDAKHKLGYQSLNQQQKPINYHKLSDSNPIKVGHRLSSKSIKPTSSKSTNHSNSSKHPSDKRGNKSTYNHWYYLKHRKQILIRTRIRRKHKRERAKQEQQKVLSQPTHQSTNQDKHKRDSNVAFKANIDKSIKTNWKTVSNPF